MRIQCSKEEFAKIVLACEKGSCERCALGDLCNGSGWEDVVEMIDIEPEFDKSPAIQSPWIGVLENEELKMAKMEFSKFKPFEPIEHEEQVSKEVKE